MDKLFFHRGNKLIPNSTLERNKAYFSMYGGVGMVF